MWTHLQPKRLLVFLNRKDTEAIDLRSAPVSTEVTISISDPYASDVVQSKTLQIDNTGDSGRKLVLDNVDIHQITHDMTEQHRNPDAHFCSLMATENRVW